MLNSFENSVLKTITKYNMLSPGDKVLVALSGGADSSVLLWVLKSLSEKLNLTLGAAHLNHGIRGEEALRDQMHSKQIANDLSVAFYTKEVCVPKYAKENKLSEEAAGRKLRYEYFLALCKEFGFNKIAVGHNLNDNTESVIMNLTRGCAMMGLSGIQPVNGNIIRPLINQKRADIEKYALEHNIEFVTDSTNLEDIYTRNIVRRKVLPTLEKINDKAAENISRCSDIVALENDFMESYVKSLAATKKIGNDVIVEREIFNSQHSAVKRRIVFEALRLLKGNTLNISASNVDALVKNSETGSRIQFHDGILATIESKRILFTKSRTKIPDYEYKVDAPCIINISEANIKVEFSFVKSADISKKDVTFVDFDKLCDGSIFLRNRRDGDNFSPSGMAGSKKIKKFFIDNKIPESERNRYPLLVSNGETAAVIGFRVDRNYIIDENTENILMIRITGGNNGQQENL